MSHYRSIAASFASTIETLSLGADTLAADIERGAEFTVAALLNGNKVMACGNGADAALAQFIVSQLNNNPDLERPPLPALSLVSDCTGLTGFAGGEFSDDPCARQIGSLGQAGDLLICIDSCPSGGSFRQTVAAAHKREMRIIALCSPGADELRSLLGTSDLCLQPDTVHRQRLQEMYLIVLNTLSDLIDQTLFGHHSGA